MPISDKQLAANGATAAKKHRTANNGIPSAPITLALVADGDSSLDIEITRARIATTP